MSPSGQTVCLTMIVKDEAPIIARCLASVMALIDSWIIVDTGSTDGTQRIIREFMTDKPGELHERPWRDFAHNRTEALALARPHGDYCLIIDADDELVVEPGFTMPDLDADSYSVDIDFDGVHYLRPQIVKASLPWRYEGVLHEYLVCEEARTQGHLPLVLRINHDGARRRDPETYRKDAKLLETTLTVETNPFLRARYTFYLAQSYRDCGETRKAISAYLNRAQMGNWREEIFYSLLQAARLMESLGDEPEQVLAVYSRASEASPTRAEAAHAASRLCRNLGQFQRGYEIAKTAIDLTTPADGLFVESWVYDYGLLDEFAVNAYWAAQYWDCLNAALRALASGKVPAGERARFVQNAQFALDRMPPDESPPAVRRMLQAGGELRPPPGSPARDPGMENAPSSMRFNLGAELGVPQKSIAIVDVGAAFFGEKPFYQPLIDQGVGTLICFEPDDAQFAKLQEHLGHNGLVLPFALGDGNAHTLHISSGGMTSLLEPDQEAYNLFSLFALPPYSPVDASIRKATVPTHKLDDISDVGPIDFLKIDIQGAELMVLKNARRKLEECSIIQVEVSFVPLYKGAPTFGDIDSELRSQGFMVHGFATIKRLPIHPYNAQGLLNGINQLVDLDMIYIRDISRIDRLPDRVLINTALAADACYSSFDLALRCVVELARRKSLSADCVTRYSEFRANSKITGYVHFTPMVQSLG